MNEEKNDKKGGDVSLFDDLWKNRKESKSFHFCKDGPQNQIQYAFSQHYSFVRKEIGIPETGSVLEVGSGRGSFSAYFAQDGYKTTLIDTSASVIDLAKKMFTSNGLEKDTEFVVGDAFKMPFEDESFDVITSIGLLEHFEDIESALKEQLRVLKKGGVFTAYVVPEKESVQNLFEPLNSFLENFSFLFNANQKVRKDPLYNNKFGSKPYLDVLNTCNVSGLKSSGVYPLPSISYSTKFPFSVMPEIFEKMLLSVFRNIMGYREKTMDQHPWSCSEEFGQSFMIWCVKDE